MNEEVLVRKVLTAIDTIKAGICKRVDVTDDVKVYECKNIIRIDIKNKKESQ